MITREFEQLYQRLNSEQKKAVDTIEGPVMVIAGPGTGKTQVLILRIAKILLDTQIEPENILALTFTESAVYEMRKRLVTLIGTAGYKVELNTFHGFCNKMIQHHNEEFDDLIAADSVDELGQMVIIESILSQGNFKYIKPFGAPLHYAKSILRTIGELKKEGIGTKDFEEGIKKQEAAYKNINDLFHTKGPRKGVVKSKYSTIEKQIERNKELLLVYKKYGDKLSSEKKYDYNDMLLRVISAFKKNPNLLMQMQELYQYFLIDEHQDTNKAQNTIIELLCNYYPNPNLFVVGDEKQAIYRFQGATLENFLYFKSLYKDAVLINLSENYRSTQMILSAASSLIDHNTSSQQLLPVQNLLAKKNLQERHIEIVRLSSYFAEYYFLADHIQKKMSEGVDPRQIAILSRNNKDIYPLVDVFEQRSIPHIVESEQNVFQDLTVQKLIALFYAIHTMGSDRELVEAMHIDVFGIDPIDIYKLIGFSVSKKTFIWDVLTQRSYQKKLSLKNPQLIESFVDMMKKWKEKSMNDSFDDVFINVLNESGFLKRILTRKHTIDITEKIAALYTLIKRLVSKNHQFYLVDFIAYIELLKKHNISINTNTKTVFKSGIRLMTAHKAKGQEFDYVYIINAYDGHWGNKRKNSNLFEIPWSLLSVQYDVVSNEGGDEDERRLFYVALTRAKKQVTITYSGYGIDEKEQVASQFIEEIDTLFRKDSDITLFEKNFISHPEILLQESKAQGSHIEREFINNKRFFSDLFTFRGLSVSGLNNYIDCPWKYFFRNLLLLPDVKNKSMIFGSAIHEALNAYLIQRKKGVVSETYVIDQYKKALSRQPLSEQELFELYAKGEKVVVDYLRARAKYWKIGLESEVNIRGIRFTEHIFLNGKIDMIERLDNKGNVAVYDFKTGKPKSRSYIEGGIKASNGNYKRQLVFYKILLDRFKEGKLKMHVKEGIIEFVEPNEKRLYQSERFIITDEEVKELEKIILQVSQEIRDMSFVNRKCEDPECFYCRLRSFMGR